MPEIKGEHLKRLGWLMLALLFLITGLGVGVYAFWVNIHPPKDSANNTASQANAASCSIDIVENQPILPNPTAFEPGGKVTQLQITDLESGSGPAAKAGDCLTVKYYGTLASNGKFFDGDFDKPQGLKFLYGGQQVIPGWDRAMTGMRVGGTRRLVIPSTLAYGSQSPSISIPANSDLVFVVKLLKLN